MKLRIRKNLITLLVLAVCFTLTVTLPALPRSSAYAETQRLWTKAEVTTLETLRQVPADQIASWSSYNSRDYDIVTSVKNQGSTNLCWVYGSLAAMETNILRQGFSDKTKDNLNLDEEAFARASKGQWDDPLNIADGNNNRQVVNRGIWNVEGAIAMVTQVASRQQGVYEEGEVAEDTLEERYSSYWLRNAITCDNNVDAIKQLIAAYGGVAFTYHSGLMDKTYLYARGTNDHASFIIGWDDTISNTQFSDTYGNTPQNDGGWIVKNSYGPSSFEDGYCYLSYDSDLFEITAFDMMSAGDYDYCYNYSDRVYNTKSYNVCTPTNPDTAEYAAIYKAQKGGEISEYLKAVSVGISGTNAQVSVSIYVNVDEDATKYSASSSTFNPKSGSLVATTSYIAPSMGIYTIALPQSVELAKDSYYTILVQVSGGSIIYDYFGYRSGTMTYVLDNGKWNNLSSPMSEIAKMGLLSIKALTVTHAENEGNDDKDVVVDISAGTLSLLGDGYAYTGHPHKPEVEVTLDGMTIPSNSYTVSYENNINAGTATVKVEGRGNYTGNLQTTFVIARADRAEFNVLLSDWTYGQEANEPSVSNYGLEEGSVNYTYGTSASGPFSADIPKKAGTYFIRAEMVATDNYESAVAIAEFTIRKAAYPDFPEEFDTLSVTGEMKKLSDIELPEGWVWQEPDMQLVAGNMHVTVVYMGEDRASYEQTAFQIEIIVPEPDDTENPGEGEEPPIVEPDDPDKKDPNEGGDADPTEPEEPGGEDKPPVVEPNDPDDGDNQGEEPPVDEGSNSEENNTNDGNEPEDENDNTAAVAVGVTSGVVGAGVLGGIAFWFIRRKRRL